MKLFKKITASILACTLLMGSVSMMTSAWMTCGNTSVNGYPAVSVKVTNSYSTARYVQPTVHAHSQVTGDLKLSMGNGGVANYLNARQTICIKNNAYYYIGYGTIYNGAGTQTGVAKSFTPWNF